MWVYFWAFYSLPLIYYVYFRAISWALKHMFNLVLKVNKQSLMLRKDRQVFLNTMQLKTADISGKRRCSKLAGGGMRMEKIWEGHRGAECVPSELTSSITFAFISCRKSLVPEQFPLSSTQGSTLKTPNVFPICIY